LIASPYVPYPLAHGGAVRMYNLMRRAAAEFDQVLVAFTEHRSTPPPELVELFTEIVLVHRPGSHDLHDTGRPEMVEEFASLAYGAALRESVRKWKPAIAQLEFTQMAQYAADCAPARTILVEHDITFDLAQQFLALEPTPERRDHYQRWHRFETNAWSTVDRVVVMSDKDRTMLKSAIVLPNGVDLDRYQPSPEPPDVRRILFIGSFAHKPNVMAIEFFVNEVLPGLPEVTLHIIAGANHESFPIAANLNRPGIELEGFVSDVRPAYRRAAAVIAPLTASAGTNIKILEAMAMGKAIVSTPAGVNGLDLIPGQHFLLTPTAAEMAAAIEHLFADPSARTNLETNARAHVEAVYDWNGIAARQTRLYRELMTS
ncbi:MAG TPA: glycosyltransferase, partial [Candidatus Acidoferrum sp.]|nr:glycosyltransferase [Candidatus Acidoferrum sp.]